MMLNKDSGFFNLYLDPSKNKLKSFEISLIGLEIPKEDYYWVLSISSDNNNKSHLKRNSDKCLPVFSIQHY